MNKHTYSYFFTTILWWEASDFVKSPRTLSSSVWPFHSFLKYILVTELPTWLHPSPVYHSAVKQHALAIVISCLNFTHFVFIHFQSERPSTYMYQTVVLITSFKNILGNNKASKAWQNVVCITTNVYLNIQNK